MPLRLVTNADEERYNVGTEPLLLKALLAQWKQSTNLQFLACLPESDRAQIGQVSFSCHLEVHEAKGAILAEQSGLQSIIVGTPPHTESQPTW